MPISATGPRVEPQFSYSEKVEIKLRARIYPEMTSDMIMYKDYLVCRNKILIVLKTTSVEVEEVKKFNEQDPLEEWRSRWFKGRKFKNKIMSIHFNYFRCN